MNVSYTVETKNLLSAVQIKSRCCRKALLFGMLYPTSAFEGGEVRLSLDLEKSVSLFTAMAKSVCKAEMLWEQSTRKSRRGEVQDVWHLLGGEECLPISLLEEFAAASKDFSLIRKCEGCYAAFIRGVFLTAGTIVAPENAYHVEFAVSDDTRCEQFCTMLTQIGFPAKITSRRGVKAIYLKESEVIEDLFTYIGAQSVSLEIMNTKIMRDIRNNENRRANCDTANIFKSTGAAAHQIRAIKQLKESGKLGTLHKNLQITAELRLEYPEVSLIELAGLHEPPITKSGVSHRLQKLVAAAEEPES